jgi:hypothetical protein
MDEIQKVLIKSGRKDLAQQYYEKVAISKQANGWDALVTEVGDRKITSVEVLLNLSRVALISGGVTKAIDLSTMHFSTSKSTIIIEKQFFDSYSSDEHGIEIQYKNDMKFFLA